MKTVWNQSGNIFQMREDSQKLDLLPNGIFIVNQSMMGYYLTRVDDNFKFNYKIYVSEDVFIDRVEKTFSNSI